MQLNDRAPAMLVAYACYDKSFVSLQQKNNKAQKGCNFTFIVADSMEGSLQNK